MPRKIIDIGVALRRASYSLRGPDRECKLRALQAQHSPSAVVQNASRLLEVTKDRIVRDWHRGVCELDLARRYQIPRHEVEQVLWERLAGQGRVA